MNAIPSAVGAVSFEPIKPHIGSTVHVDKAQLCDPEIVQAIRNALEDRGVLVFPRLGLNDAEQLAFTDAFGQRLNYTKSVSRGETGDDADVYKIALGEEGGGLAPEFV